MLGLLLYLQGSRADIVVFATGDEHAPQAAILLIVSDRLSLCGIYTLLWPLRTYVRTLELKAQVALTLLLTEHGITVL